MRRSHDRTKGRGPLHLGEPPEVGSGATGTAEKSNEITAIPLLLERLALTGTLVTIDAMGTAARIAQAVLDRGANYLLALKTDQRHLSGGRTLPRRRARPRPRQDRRRRPRSH